MRLPSLALVVALVASGSACVAGSDDAGATGALELGTGSWRFEPIEDGQELELVRGAQGGWHLWTSVRLTNVAAGRTTLVLETQPADEGRPPSRTEATVNLDPMDREGRRAVIGWPNVIEDPACVVGRMLRVEARVVDDDGVELVSERLVVPLGGTYPPPPCGE